MQLLRAISAAEGKNESRDSWKICVRTTRIVKNEKNHRLQILGCSLFIVTAQSDSSVRPISVQLRNETSNSLEILHTCARRLPVSAFEVELNATSLRIIVRLGVYKFRQRLTASECHQLAKLSPYNPIADIAYTLPSLVILLTEVDWI